MYADIGRKKYLIIYTLLATFLFVSLSLGITTAEPKPSPTEKGKSASQSAVAKPDAKPDGKFLINEYEDPGKPKAKANFFIQLISTVWDIIKYIFYLALVLGIGFLAIYGIKLFTNKYNAITGSSAELINLLEIRYLAPGKAICLVEVAGKVLALGLSGNSINPLSEFTDTEQVDALKKAAAKKPEPLQPFQAVLEKFTKRFSNQPRAKTAKIVKKRHGARVTNDTGWKDDLYSTNDNIRKILDEIKERERKTKGSNPTSKRDRGEDKK